MTDGSVIELPPGRLTAQAPRPGELLLSAQDQAGPWRSQEYFRMLVIVSVGIIGLSVCWFVGSGELTYQDQVPWLVGSIASAGVTVVGLVYWLVCGFRQVNLLQRDAMLVLGPWAAAQRAAFFGPELVETHADGVLVVAPRMHKAHRPGCQLARGKTGLEQVQAADLADRGLTMCGVCNP